LGIVIMVHWGRIPGRDRRLRWASRNCSVVSDYGEKPDMATIRGGRE
jgi:hypothetical protein